MAKRMGRPPKSPEELFVTRSIRFPPDLWQVFSAAVPAGQRGKVLQWGLRRELDRLQREADRRGVSVGELVLARVRDERRQRQIERLQRLARSVPSNEGGGRKE